MIYLDNSATTYPKPPEVIRAVRNGMMTYGFNPGRGGYRQSLKTAQKVFDSRENIGSFFHVSRPENVIFTCGCTQALNMVIKGVLHMGDHVVISSLEHNAVARPIHKLKEDGKITYHIAEAVIGDDETTIANFRNVINADTRLIICTHASNVFGFRLPTERICALAHQYGILFCLDAAQTAGVLPIDMEKDGYDFVCCAGHKYLYGPMGTGLLLTADHADLDTLTEGGTGSLSSELSMPDFYPDRLEAGTLNLPGIAGLNAGIQYIQRTGMESIYHKESRLIRRLSEQLSSMRDVTVYDHPLSHHDAPVLSFSVRDIDSETVARSLSDHADIAVRGGLHCAPLAHQTMHTEEHGTVRISPSVFTVDRDIALTVNSLRKII